MNTLPKISSTPRHYAKLLHHQYFLSVQSNSGLTVPGKMFINVDLASEIRHPSRRRELWGCRRMSTDSCIDPPTRKERGSQGRPNDGSCLVFCELKLLTGRVYNHSCPLYGNRSRIQPYRRFTDNRPSLGHRHDP